MKSKIEPSMAFVPFSSARLYVELKVTRDRQNIKKMKMRVRIVMGKWSLVYCRCFVKGLGL